MDCPPDVNAELSPGRDEAFVTFDQPSTDLDWFRYVRSKPTWGTRLEANLKLGVHEVTFYARHPVSKKQTTCDLRITVTSESRFNFNLNNNSKHKKYFHYEFSSLIKDVSKFRLHPKLKQLFLSIKNDSVLNSEPYFSEVSQVENITKFSLIFLIER